VDSWNGLRNYGLFLQDSYNVDRFTVNVGLRYDLITGFQFDQSLNPNFVKAQNAGKAGQLTGIKGMENFGKDPKDDTNNWQPRVGFAWDIDGSNRNVVRGGFGIYMDMAYTNSNALFAASDASGKGFGTVLNVDNQSGIRNPDGSFYQVGQPIANIQSQNSAVAGFPLFGQFTDPRLQMPYTRQTTLGWSHQLASNTVFTADFVRADGRDLNTRPRINTIQANGTRRLAFLNLAPNAIGTRPAVSSGKSEYTAGIFAVKRRLTNGIDFTGTYTLASAKSTAGTAVDELNANNLQDATLLYDDPKVLGPTSRTDARHSGTIAAVFLIKGFSIAPFYIFKSPLPVSITEGLDTNANGERNDIPLKAYQYDGIGKAPKEIGDCETYNCGRGAWRTQFNMRVSKGFRLVGNARVEAIGEVFNLFNASNPTGFTTTRLLGTGAVNTNFMQPISFSGDFQQPEQRVGQIGFRFSF
jgi:hypothetical protein